MLLEKNDPLVSLLDKKTRFIDYKYSLKYLYKRFIIFIINMHISFSYKTLVLTPNQEQIILFLEFNFFIYLIYFT